MIESAEMADSERFAALCRTALAQGLSVRFRAHGQSMQPNVMDGDIVEVEPLAQGSLRRGDIALTRCGRKMLIHRVTGWDAADGHYVTRGDAGRVDDLPADEVLGRVVSIERDGKKRSLTRPGATFVHSARKHARRLRAAISLRICHTRFLLVPVLFAFFGFLLAVPSARAQFTITDTAAPATVAPGGTITFTQVLTYNGAGTFTPTNANPLTTTQAIPANTTLVSYTINGTAKNAWNCGVAGGTLTCTESHGPPNYKPPNSTTTTFTITVTVNSGTPVGTVITDTVTANPGSSTASASSTVIPASNADLSVSQTETPNPVVAGGNITYTQTVSNVGPQDALNATLNELIPANTTFQSIVVFGANAAGWSCTTPAVGGTGTVSCTNPDVPPGATGAATFTVVVNVSASTVSGTQIVDTVSVTSGTNDPNLANNSATVLTVVGAANSADLTITNSASPNPVLAGSNITYTVVVTNQGPSTASSVLFSETVPANTTLVSVAATSGTAGWTCSAGVISCTIASFPAGASTTFTVVVLVNAGTPSGTVITDTANVSSSTTDPNPSSNIATTTVVVATAGQADLAVTKTATPNPVLAGNPITYTITVTNNGPAPAVNVTLTDVLPGNTTFTSMSASPAGTWICPAPTGGNETCTNVAVAANTTTTFTLIVTVNAGTPAGTAITNSATVSSTTSDPTSANNSASATSVVASPTQADVAIVKTALPEPVDQGTNLTYTLQVTNNGPAIAQNVVVNDPLPSEVTFVSVSIPSSQGTCSQAAGTVTCNIPSLGVSGLVTITINTNAATFSSTTLVTNTATASATTGDPNPANNTSSAVSTIASPTAVEVDSFQARLRPGGGVVLKWRTREETRNLGFHVYREDASGRHRLDPSLIAGSALFFRGGYPQHRARTYEWIDPQGGPDASYWIEDVDLNGTSTLHGPVYPEAQVAAQSSVPVTQARLMTQLNQAIVAATPSHIVRGLETPAPASQPLASGVRRVSLNGRAALKISVTTEGWYRVTGAQIAAAGLSNVNVRTLQLYAEGVEQPILILGNQNGILGPNDNIEFYGTGIDTPFSGTRVYWLVGGWRLGERIRSIPAAGSGVPTAQSFPFSVLFQQRTTYFAALLNGADKDNFFGAIVSSTPVNQVLTVGHLDATSTIPTTLDVTLQGVTQGQEHRVSVSLNGLPLGEMDFTGQANSTMELPVNTGVAQNGRNTVTLTAMDGETDVSLVQSIQLNYAHTYTADSDWLRAQAPAGATIRIDGFTEPTIEVFDITNPNSIVQLSAPVTSNGSSYGVTLAVDGPAGTERNLLAFSDDQISAPAGLTFHPPSLLGRRKAGADYIVITHPDFESSIQPLVKLHESQGESVAVVTTDQIYDAFNYGEHSPFALRDFLQFAATNWRVHPKAVLLVGDASFDPRNYLGFGDFDFVPTRMIETAAFKTASDDWLTDFNNTGFATIPTGRLPVRTPEQAALIVSKIVNYESGASAGSWKNQAVVIADQNIDADFTSEANIAAASLPPSMHVTKILADGKSPSTVRQQIQAALNSGALLVNYTGHGSEEQWSFANLFNDSTATGLSNGDRLPVYLLMDCLNGFFHDVYATSLSTSLMLAPNGGAVAVWASSGFTDASPQATMDQAFLSAWAANPRLPIGNVILAAKSGITDADVRRTWILFGDPDMCMQPPSTTQTARPRTTHIIVQWQRSR